VLVVEDSPSTRLTIAHVLRARGFTTFTARDGREALDVAARERPSAVLLDAMLPDVDGFELCRRLKAAPAAPAVIMVTSLGRPSDAARARAAGADHYTTKPFDEERALTLLEAVLGRQPREEETDEPE
jgi:DNA-binding response OmpR family regulator